MRINADFSRTVIVMPSQHHWVPSPQAGVERVMLDRLGAEAGRSTSIVRYAPGAGFPHHQHPAGEEIFVWDRKNLFFGGVQAVTRDPASGALSGGADPRRGGAVAVA